MIEHEPPLPEGHEQPNGTDVQDLEENYSTRANWLRAAVLGANDGLVSVAAIMLGVSGGTPDSMRILLLSGLSALVAGENLRFGAAAYCQLLYGTAEPHACSKMSVFMLAA